MEHQKILNLLNEASDSKFVTRKWNIFNDQSYSNYDAGNEIIQNTKVLKSNLCIYNDVCILVRCDNTIIGHQVIQEPFKNCAPFIKCITKIDGTTIDDTENLDVAIPMYKLMEYIPNYSEATGILWFYSKDEATIFNADIANNLLLMTKLLGNTEANGANEILRNATNAVSLKYLSNVLRSFEMLLINCKIELKLKWTKHCVLSSVGADNTDANPNTIIFTIKDTK